jgi:hypothetical protein
MSKWKMQSEQLRAAMRNNRLMAEAQVCAACAVGPSAPVPDAAAQL